MNEDILPFVFMILGITNLIWGNPYVGIIIIAVSMVFLIAQEIKKYHEKREEYLISLLLNDGWNNEMIKKGLQDIENKMNNGQ